MPLNEGSSQPTLLDLTPSLVAQLRDGNPEAGTMLESLYRESLVRFCWGYLGRMDQAEDAVQDVCCKVLASERIPDDFRPWCYKIARNHCLNLLRSRETRKDGGPPGDVSQAQEMLTGHLTRLVRDEQHARLSDLVANLSESQQEVLRLRYVEDLSRTEIADVLDVPESLVKSRLFEGLKRLREFSSLLDA